MNSLDAAGVVIVCLGWSLWVLEHLHCFGNGRFVLACESAEVFNFHNEKSMSAGFFFIVL